MKSKVVRSNNSSLSKAWWRSGFAFILAKADLAVLICADQRAKCGCLDFRLTPFCGNFAFGNIAPQFLIWRLHHLHVLHGCNDNDWCHSVLQWLWQMCFFHLAWNLHSLLLPWLLANPRLRRRNKARPVATATTATAQHVFKRSMWEWKCAGV